MRMPGRTLGAILLVALGAAAAALAFVAAGFGSGQAIRGFTACVDSRGYLYVPPQFCRAGTRVTWDGEIPAVAQGAKSLAKGAIVESFDTSTARFGKSVKDPGGWTRTKSYVARCPLDYVAVGGRYSVEWPYVYDVNIVASRPRDVGGLSAWEVYAVSAKKTNSPPEAVINVSAICIRRTSIFPTG